ncbi:GFA family protein [Pontixanthobacter gangjinensis]|nr:GFA family protein [Pontixanthobacter gangjinensis]
MNDKSNKIKGNCLCGSILFEIVNDFAKLYFCNCNQCRKITGSAFASNLFIDVESFDWLAGSDGIAIYKVPNRDIAKSFCRKCGSGVPWPSSDGAMMIVPAGCLNGEPEVKGKFRIFTAEEPRWSTDFELARAHQEFLD